jgi:hypothetical protein
VGLCRNPWTLTDEQSGLLTLIVAMESEDG